MSPPEDAENVEPTTAVTATFDDDIDPGSIDTMSFSLADGSGTIPSTVSYDATTRTARLEPGQPLVLMRTYTATLSTAVHDTDGNSLAAAQRWDFTVRDGTWTAAEQITVTSRAPGRVAVALGPEGSAVALWVDGTPRSLWSSAFVPTSGWGTPELVETDEEGDVESIATTCDLGGRTTVVWSQGDSGGGSNIWANQYSPSMGWSGAIRVDDAGSGGQPQIDVDGSGNVVAVWEQAGVEIWASRYVTGSGWGPPGPVATPGVSAVAPRVSVAEDGTSFVVWEQRPPGEIWSRSSNPTGVWSSPQRIGSGTVLVPDVAVDRGGAATSVWWADSAIWGSRYSRSVGWGTPEVLGEPVTGAPDTYSPQVVSDDVGNAIAMWGARDGTGAHVWANHYAEGMGWGTAEVLADETFRPHIEMDGAGRALIVTTAREGGRQGLWGRRYLPAIGWLPLDLIQEHSQIGATHVAMNDSGQGVAVWARQDGGVDSIWSSRFE